MSGRGQPPKKRFIKPIHSDKYFGSGKISGLIGCNFYNFLGDKQAALVMFYNPEEPACARLKPHMLKQAKDDKDPDHAYAAVNCLEEPELCQREGMTNWPGFKMYTRGMAVNQFGDAFDYLQMDHMMKKCPVMPPLHKSRKPEDPECIRPQAQTWRTS